MSRRGLLEGNCELCGATPEYVDSVPRAAIAGYPNASVYGYRHQLLCSVCAAARREHAMSRLQPVLRCASENGWRLDFDRVSGDCICFECGLAYRKHVMSADYPFLLILCDGSLVKL